MKKIIVFIFLAALLASCSPIAAEKEQSIEMIAFNSLSEKEQKLIPTSPKDSVVTKQALTAGIKSHIDSNYDKKEVYSVVFNDSATSKNGNLIVFIDLNKEVVIGKTVQGLN